MSLAADIAAVLSGDAALIAIFGVRIISYEALGDLGLNRNAYPSAFDANGEILPTLVIRDRNANATFEMRGEDEQISSYLQAAEIVGYSSRLTGDTNIETGLARVYTLLQDRNVQKVRGRERMRVNGQREPQLNYCFMGWSIWDFMGLNKP